MDVKDCALCHVLAAESNAAQGKRYLTIGSAFSQPKAAQTIARLFPGQAHRLPEPPAAPIEHYSYSVTRYVRPLSSSERARADCSNPCIALRRTWACSGHRLIQRSKRPFSRFWKWRRRRTPREEGFIMRNYAVRRGNRNHLSNTSKWFKEIRLSRSPLSAINKKDGPLGLHIDETKRAARLSCFPFSNAVGPGKGPMDILF